MCTGLHVEYSLLLSDFHETCILSTDFRKNTQISNLMTILPVGTEFHADGLTDGRGEANSRFSQFCVKVCFVN